MTSGTWRSTWQPKPKTSRSRRSSSSGISTWQTRESGQCPYPLNTPSNTPNHVALTAAVTLLLGLQLRSKPCRVSCSDLKVRILATGLATYPDLTVVCSKLETNPQDANAATNPTLLVEVLSNSSEASERGGKFAHYRRLPSLREYVLVSHLAPRIGVWRRNDANRWELAQEAGVGERAEVASVACTLSVDEVYADPLAQPA